MTSNNLQPGTPIYYTGDAANAEGAGHITKRPVADGLLNVTLNDGRIFRGLFPAVFDASPGQRFMTRTEYDAKRAEKIAQFKMAFNQKEKLP